MKQLVKWGVLLLLSSLVLLSACSESKQTYKTKVVAHRGFWDTEGSAQNSLASLRKAAEHNLYAIEIDVRLTSDSVVVLFHDNDLNSIPVADLTSEEVRSHTLENGETVPTFEEFLLLLKEYPKIVLMCEVKTSSESLDDIVAERVVSHLKEMDLLGRTEFISFSLPICLDLKEQAPYTNVAYLSGDLSPKEVKTHGLDGIDYHFVKLIEKPEWIEEAHELGMEVNCWTVNKAEDLKQMLNLGVDYITTDAPLLAKELIDQGK